MALGFEDCRALSYTGCVLGDPCPRTSGSKCRLSSQEGLGQVVGHCEQAEHKAPAAERGRVREQRGSAGLTAAPSARAEGRGGTAPAPPAPAWGGPCENEAGALGPGGAGPGVSEAAGRAPAHTSPSRRRARRPRSAASARSRRAAYGGRGPRLPRGGPGAAASALAAAADGGRPARPRPRPGAAGG